MTLAPNLAVPLAQALTAHAAYVARRAGENVTDLMNARFASVSQVMQALGLDRAAHPGRVLSDELVGDRHTVLVELTKHGVPLRSVAELPGPWVMRRLLGLARPGILEELGVGWGTTRLAVVEALATVPPELRLEAHVEAELAGWGVLNAAVLADLRPVAPAALAYAQATLPLLSPDESPQVRAALFTVFSAAGAPVPEGADERLLVGGPPELLAEHFEALAPERRDAVLTGLLARPRTSSLYEVAMQLIETFPGLPRAAAALRQLIDESRTKRLTPYEKKALTALDRRLRNVERAVDGGKKRAGQKRGVAALPASRPARVIEVSRRSSPRDEGMLGELAARQLVETGRRFDGEALPVARRLSADENDEGALGAILEHVVLTEGGRPVFEAWLHGDSGVFFAAGTCDVIAVRGREATALEGADDEALERALHAIGPSKAAVRSLAEIAAATAPKTKRASKKSPRSDAQTAAKAKTRRSR